ncbi:uncharacterized protein EAF02_010026 [Botrytis sinoallii]|uniref:uncharacterized protein n=1 Tax=Botrytis sinoallii TaxID=1463999 RepID=UPI001901706F|nr:uncharacterized protein EAF02_010026 [Botrytis sinoallii]KAF7865603.1 hypothetical protein EAF02_010026 [Botrytis sinoallii]
MASNATTPAAGQTAGNGAPAASATPPTGPPTAPPTEPPAGPPAEPPAGLPAPAPPPAVEVDIGINQQPVIEQTRKRKQEGFEDTRPKRLGMPKDDASPEERALAEFRIIKSDLGNWYVRNRGRDYPGPKTLAGKINGSRSAILILKEIGRGATEMLNVRVKFDMFSQAPRLRIFAGEYHFSLHSHNFAAMTATNQIWKQKVHLITEASDEAKNASRAEIAKILATDFQSPCQRDVDRLIEFAQHNREPLLEFFGFNLGGPFYWDAKPESAVDLAVMEVFMSKLSHGRFHATLVRSLNPVARASFEYHDAHWKSQMEASIRHGTYPFYRKVIGDTAGEVFKDWEKDPNITLMHQRWMRHPHFAEELKSYASHAARRSFGSPRDMQIGLSLGVIFEGMWEKYNISRYFSPEFTHQSTVKSKKGPFIQLHVTVEKDENFAMPDVAPGTHMKFTVVPLPIDPEAPKEPVADPGFIMVKGMKQKRKAMPPGGWMPATEVVKARVLSVDTQMDFVLGFQIVNADYQKAFSNNANLEICIEMDRNTIPANRMLMAIAKLCGPPRAVNEFRQRAFLMGHGVENVGSSIYTEFKDQMTKQQRGAFDYLCKSMDMNKQQLRAWELMFYSNCHTSLLQGPPGTGKTKTVAGQGLGLALCGVKTLITAPSNTAAREVMIKLLDMLATIREKFPQVDEWFDIVYLPTRGTTISDLKEADIDWDSLAYDIVVEGESQTGQAGLDKNALWKHVVKSFEEDAENKDDAGKQQVAKQWLITLKQFKNCIPITSKEKKKFFLRAESKTQEIFTSLTSKVKIVICTCNTAHLLQGYGYKPQACLTDEAAFGAEPEVLIPAALCASKNQYSGDHKQLHPVVKSAGHNEFSNQLGLSLFERFFNHHSAHLVRFNMNYRMCKRIANFPGIATYGFLASHASTMVESDTLKYYNQWWNSDNAEPYRAARRKPEFGGPKDDNAQRLFINVRDGKSAPREGGKSKRNFANINAVCDFTMNLFRHEPTVDVTKIDLDKITVLILYKEELHEISRQLMMRLKAEYPKIERFPRFRTIDSTQGGENEVVLLAVTPADQYNGGLIGFLSEWNRMNVALTRGKSVMVIFGNLDLWRSQLVVITQTLRAKNFALMIMDLLDLGDVIDVDGDNWLPKTFAQLRNGRPAWTMEIEKTRKEDSQLTPLAKSLLSMHQDPAVKTGYEQKLLAELVALRKVASDFEKLEEAGVEYNLPSFGPAEQIVDGVQEEVDEEDSEGIALRNLFPGASMKDKAEKKDADGDEAMKDDNGISLIDKASATIASEISKEATDRENAAKESSGDDTAMSTDENIDEAVNAILEDLAS